MTTELRKPAIVAARYPGEVILGYHRRVDQVELKDDRSRLALAGKAAHNAIAAWLQESATVSEGG